MFTKKEIQVLMESETNHRLRPRYDSKEDRPSKNLKTLHIAPQKDEGCFVKKFV